MFKVINQDKFFALLFKKDKVTYEITGYKQDYNGNDVIIMKRTDRHYDKLAVPFSELIKKENGWSVDGIAVVDFFENIYVDLKKQINNLPKEFFSYTAGRFFIPYLERPEWLNPRILVQSKKALLDKLEEDRKYWNNKKNENKKHRKDKRLVFSIGRLFAFVNKCRENIESFKDKISGRDV